MTIRFHFPALLGALFVFLSAQSASAQNIRATYGSRSPRACTNTKAPASGPLSAQQALQYFICGQERVSGDYLYLVDQVQIQIGKGRPFLPGSDLMTDADTDSPVYPIRGSFVSYQVSKLSTILENAGKNCLIQVQPNAKGICYRTTFGDWKCSMSDLSNNSSNWRYNVASPQ